MEHGACSSTLRLEDRDQSDIGEMTIRGEPEIMRLPEHFKY